MRISRSLLYELRFCCVLLIISIFDLRLSSRNGKLTFMSHSICCFPFLTSSLICSFTSSINLENFSLIWSSNKDIFPLVLCGDIGCDCELAKCPLSRY